MSALRGKPTEYTPIWLMRQAGRYLPEYREIRASAGSFMALATNPELATEVTLQPIRRFDLDAAIIFSDILTVPDAMGLGLHFEPGIGPLFKHPLREEHDFKSLEVPEVREKLSYVFDAIRLTKRELDGKVPLIGFCGSPFTLACYMIEGGSSRDFVRTKQVLYQRPDLLHHLLSLLSDALVAYLTEQVRAGADALQIFDTWGGTLSTPSFKAFSLHYTAKIVQALKEQPETADVPIIGFTKDAPATWYRLYEEIGVAAIGVDWRHELSEVAETLDGKCALQGNLDPLILLGSDKQIELRTREILEEMSDVGAAHIFNLGHGMNKNVDPEKVRLLIDLVHHYSAELRA